MTTTHQKREKAAAQRACDFINRLTHTKGRWAGCKFNLRDWQRKIVSDIFGPLNDDGTRRVRTAYVEIPRKNGKSELGAAIALRLLLGDGEQGAEVYSAAGDKDQASLVFNVAASMVRNDKKLSKILKVLDSQKRIVYPRRNSFYRAISAEHSTKHGFDASGIVFDELHTQPDRQLWDVLETGKGARRQPLTVAITTAGHDSHSICYEQHDYARKIEKGIVTDPTFYGCIFAAKATDDWTSESVWKKANPALGDFRSIEEMRTACKRAQVIPAQENTFRNLYLNQWTKQATRFLSIRKWDDSAGEKIDEKQLEGLTCYGGLDLSSTTDLSALVLVFPPKVDGGVYRVLCHFWIPESTMREKALADRVPYEVWVRSGLMTATPGEVIDYGFIYHQIDKWARKFDIQEIAFDRWGATKISQTLEEKGLTMVEFGQGFASMSPPTKELLTLVLQRKIQHGGNPVLRWNADNLVVQIDAAGGVKPNKAKSREKIDGMVALIMALDRAIKHTQNLSVYETRGVFVL
jgi:phage terminase large subunit-like protein